MNPQRAGKLLRHGRLLPVILLSCLAGTLFGGCSALLRALDLRVGNLPLAPGEAPLDPGRYSGSSTCATLTLVEGELPVSETVPLTVEIEVNQDRRLTRNGIAIDAGQVAELSAGRYNLALTSTATESSRDSLAALSAAEVTVDAGTTAEFVLAGDATETFKQADDGGVLYALATELLEQGVDGERGPRTLAVQCEFPLERQ